MVDISKRTLDCSSSSDPCIAVFSTWRCYRVARNRDRLLEELAMVASAMATVVRLRRGKTKRGRERGVERKVNKLLETGKATKIIKTY